MLSNEKQNGCKPVQLEQAKQSFTMINQLGSHRPQPVNYETLHHKIKNKNDR